MPVVPVARSLAGWHCQWQWKNFKFQFQFFTKHFAAQKIKPARESQSWRKDMSTHPSSPRAVVVAASTPLSAAAALEECPASLGAHRPPATSNTSNTSATVAPTPSALASALASTAAAAAGHAASLPQPPQGSSSPACSVPVSTIPACTRAAIEECLEPLQDRSSLQVTGFPPAASETATRWLIPVTSAAFSHFTRAVFESLRADGWLDERGVLRRCDFDDADACCADQVVWNACARALALMHEHDREHERALCALLARVADEQAAQSLAQDAMRAQRVLS